MRTYIFICLKIDVGGCEGEREVANTDAN